MASTEADPIPPAEPAAEESTKAEDLAEPAAEPITRRRSTRITSTSKLVPPVLEKKKRAPRKRTADEADTEDNADNAADEGGAKKAKTNSQIEIGDILPSLTLKTEDGQDVNVQDLAVDNGLVIFLVPKADTPGCTTQACGFRDIYPDFESVKYKVYCLSADSPVAQSKWKTKKSLPYPLLSDPKREFIEILTGSKNKTARSHFIFKKGGKLLDRKIPVKPAESPKLALEFVKSQSASIEEGANGTNAPGAPSSTEPIAAKTSVPETT